MYNVVFLTHNPFEQHFISTSIKGRSAQSHVLEKHTYTLSQMGNQLDQAREAINAYTLVTTGDISNIVPMPTPTPSSPSPSSSPSSSITLSPTENAPKAAQSRSPSPKVTVINATSGSVTTLPETVAVKRRVSHQDEEEEIETLPALAPKDATRIDMETPVAIQQKSLSAYFRSITLFSIVLMIVDPVIFIIAMATQS